MTHGRFAYQWNEMWAEAGQPHEQTEKKTHLRGRHWIFFSSRSSFSPSWTVRVRGRTDQALKPQPRVSGTDKEFPAHRNSSARSTSYCNRRISGRFVAVYSQNTYFNKKKLQFGLLLGPDNQNSDIFPITIKCCTMSENHFNIGHRFVWP